MKFKVFLFFIALISIVSSVLHAAPENAVNTKVNFEITRDNIQAKIETINAKQGIDEVSKGKEIKWYQLADENIANEEWYLFLSKNYKEILETASKNPTKKQTSNIFSGKTPISEKDKNLSEDVLALQIVNLKEELRSITNVLNKLATDLSQYNDRPQQIREEMQAAQTKLAQVKLDMAAPLKPNENKYEYAAHQVYLQSLIRALTAEITKLDLETASNPIQIRLAKQEQELLVNQQEKLTAMIAERERWMNEFRAKKATQLEEEILKARQDNLKRPLVIQEIVNNTINWSSSLQQVIQDTNQHSQMIDKMDAYRQEISDYYKHADTKIKLAGLSPALGRVLREQKRSMINERAKYQVGTNIQDEANLISLEQYKVEDRQAQLRNIEAQTEKYVTELQAEKQGQITAEELKERTEEIHNLLIKEDQVLDELNIAYSQGLRVLGDFDFSKQQLLMEIKRYDAYLNEHLLWVPSSKAIDFTFPIEIYNSVVWLFSPTNWLKLSKYFLVILKSQLLLSSLALIGLALLIYAKSFIKQKKVLLKSLVSKHSTDKISYTFEVLLYNLILVMPAPLVLSFVGYMLAAVPYEYGFSRALGAGLYGAAFVLFMLNFFLRFFEPDGIAALHFKWQENTVLCLRKQISWMRFIVVPSIFGIYMTIVMSAAEHSESLGRLAMIVFMSVLCVFFMRVLHPKKGVFSRYFLNHPKVWWTKLRYVWFVGALSIPLVIIGFTLMGYFISALELQNKVVITMRMIFVAIIVHSMVLRWLTLTNRKMALKNLRQKRKAQETSEKSMETLTSEEILAQEEVLDIPKINEQTVNVVNILIIASLAVGFSLLWSNMVPAFSFLQNIVLWQHIVNVEGQDVLQAITLVNLLFAGLYVFIVVNAVINFPGVMELLFFRNFNIAAGTRYAINQMAKYILIVIGFISTANELGGSWSQVQWLVAGLTVGLGFGLQEIFANLVSGVILLFERPIRVGDTVTIDGNDGTVMRIQMRATTIMDWDKKEVIVPNKTFITNKLVNWTLTETVTRVVIPIGVSYGTDVEVAHKLILDTIRSTPLVLKDPEPAVLFVEFGDSSLNFSARFFVNELSHRLPVTHDIHMRILAAFRKQGIEIPFPQRDVHIHQIQA
ncbi:MAG: mechanosensitive ion channel [Methyloprofundus sp.]|nr:mechanosensitive ion channel [Methyloprofundus sp.]